MFELVNLMLEPCTLQSDGCILIGDGPEYYGRYPEKGYLTGRIISRASDTLKTWNEMTDEELVALLLADHRGEVIEWRHPQDVYDDWDTENLRFGIPYMAYRVRPPEPKRKTVYVYQDCGFKAVGTIDLIDGTPDCASISMEELK